MLQAGTIEATRSTLMQYELYGPRHDIFAAITLKNTIWPAEGAPATPHLPNAFTGYPEIAVGPRHYLAHRRLTSDRMLTNDFDIWLTDETGQSAITARNPARVWTSAITFAGTEYALRRKSFFRYAFDLSNSAGPIATFRDTTPFWTFNSTRRFAIALHQPADELLLTFSLFLSTSIVFRS